MSSLVIVFDLDDTLYPERQFAVPASRPPDEWARRSSAIEGLADDMTQLLDGGHLGELSHRAGREAPDHGRSTWPPWSRPTAITSRNRPVRRRGLGARAFRADRPGSG